MGYAVVIDAREQARKKLGALQEAVRIRRERLLSENPQKDSPGTPTDESVRHRDNDAAGSGWENVRKE